eukprot:TRINITY_DN19263_c0_g1_i1.p1 TRINITY_DN19263_c0_g1~~TRINITY_DN19263_c0_g1_i1.p1  ORF type:complete len:530 (+),score=95.38 TRINITY_DN19263_c0_g1_i1:81-1592(+)
MANALQGIGAAVSAQLLSRAVTFLLNVAIARLAAPSAYGMSYISLQLFSNLSLFATKEGFRKVALRPPEDAGLKEDGLRSSTNLGWGGSIAACVTSLPLAAYWLYSAPAAATSSYFIAIGIMALASVVEAVGEPFLIRTLAAQDFRRRAVGEGVAILVRTGAMFLLAVLQMDLPLAFAVAQLLYGVVWSLWFARGSLAGLAVKPELRPSRLGDAARGAAAFVLPFHRTLLAEFGGMVFLKLLLTEGEKFLLLALFAEKEWGVFGLVSNIGSIVLRLLFAPTEEIAYSAFTAVGSPKEQWGLLRALLLLQGGVGWLGLCFGPGFAALVVRVLWGADWASTEAPKVLAAYCVLLFCMAMNGILEAYMYSQCTPDWVRKCNGFQLAISLVLVASASTLRSFGPVALVWANCLQMLLRVTLCGVFVQRHLSLSWADLNIVPVLRLFSLLAASGYACSLVVPSVTDGVPWLRAAQAVFLAVLAIIVVLALCRQELIATFKKVRDRKSS